MGFAIRGKLDLGEGDKIAPVGSQQVRHLRGKAQAPSKPLDCEGLTPPFTPIFKVKGGALDALRTYGLCAQG